MESARRSSRGSPCASAPADVFLAADAGAFAALSGQDVGVAGIRVAPPQVAVRGSRPHGVVGVLELAMVNCRSGLKCASIGLAQEALVGVGHSSTSLFSAQCRILAPLCAEMLSRTT
ncbi:hypothetical protein AOB60_02315 [Streptomyces noursei]|uniref:Uncharacterized protein n=1 Tax=Streptomyces noursei TaxID=1971 RepID=A0A2N8PG12_STRNR|nr:hypothetical protein AOB60_02315 [Streptomyces noursei]